MFYFRMVLGYGNLDSLALKHSENILSLTFGRKCKMIVGVSDIFSDVHCTLYKVFLLTGAPLKILSVSRYVNSDT